MNSVFEPARSADFRPLNAIYLTRSRALSPCLHWRALRFKSASFRAPRRCSIRPPISGPHRHRSCGISAAVREPN
jgi:hypothetical protein